MNSTFRDGWQLPEYDWLYAVQVIKVFIISLFRTYRVVASTKENYNCIVREKGQRTG